MMLKNITRKKINTSLAVSMLILLIIVATAITALYISLYPLIDVILAFVGISIGVGGVILILLSLKIYRLNKRLERIDKGKKLLETEQKRIEVLPKWMKIGVIFYLVITSTFGVFLLVKGEGVGIALFMCAIAQSTTFFGRKKVEIYERGILQGLIFVKWKDVKKVEWNNGVLRIWTNKISGRVFEIKDKNKRIKEVIDKYVNR